MQRSMNGRSAPPASAALTRELHEIVENDRYPLSPRVRTLQGILDKLDPPPPTGALTAAEGVSSAAQASTPVNACHTHQ